jgi:hypothetical protein
MVGHLVKLILSIFILSLTLAEPGFAKDQKKAAGGGGSRERVINREARSKVGSKTKIDFEDTDIGGAAKTPYGTMLSNTKSNKNYDMVPIRTDWRPEMLQSASALDAGRSR